MGRLSHKELKNLLSFLQDCYSLRSVTDFPDYLVGALKAVVPGEIYSYNELCPSKKQAVAKWSPSTLPMIPDGLAILATYADQNPVVPYFEKSGDGSAKKISDFTTHRQFQNCALHNEFYLPFRIRYHLSMALISANKSIRTLSVHRWKRDFSEQERMLLDFIRPHLVQAFRNNGIFTALMEEVSSRQIALEQANRPLLSLKSNGRIHWATPSAWTLVKKFCCLKGRDQLNGALTEWVQSQNQQMDFKNLDEGRRSFKLRGITGSMNIGILSSSEKHTLLHFQETPDQFPIASLRALGLSPRETEVLGWVAQGKSNPDIAGILNISVRTVQKHMERIFNRLGVENRHAAIVLALETAAGNAPVQTLYEDVP